MKKIVIISSLIALISLLASSVLWAGEIKYNREKAKNYATLHCSFSAYNHEKYKCWDPNPA